LTWKNSLVVDLSRPPEDTWIVEGNARCFAGEGKLWVDARERRVATLWYPEPFPGDLEVRYTGRSLEPGTGHNLNLFFCATGPDGGPLFPSDRTGAYAEYHELPNYTFTLTYKWSRIRRNPGFRMLSDRQDLASREGVDYEVVVAKRGGLIRVTVNGTLAHEVKDPEPLDGGWVGLRTWHTLAIYSEFRVLW